MAPSPHERGDSRAEVANIDQILQVEILHEDHLYWPKLDIDLHLDSIRSPESFPLIYQ